MSPVPSPAPLPPQNQPSVSGRHKHKPFAVGIAAGAEDAKYQAKYKELKRKVKDIENVILTFSFLLDACNMSHTRRTMINYTSRFFRPNLVSAG